MKKVIDIYKDHADDFNKSSRELFSWKFIDKSALIEVLGDCGITSSTQILDLACGSGRVIDVLHEQGVGIANITGIDTSKTLLKSAKEKYTSARFINADITAHDKFEDVFDIATAVHVFAEFDTKTLARTFKNIYKALKPGGKLIYIVGHPLRYVGIHDYFNRARRKQKTPWGAVIDHSHKTIEDYLTATLSAGFSIGCFIEPIVIQDGERINKEKYKEYTKTPSRLVIVAVK